MAAGIVEPGLSLVYDTTLGQFTRAEQWYFVTAKAGSYHELSSNESE